jgi:predicted nucleic acid-binding protein
LPLADGMIAAIAYVHGFAVATRDVAPFIAAGVKTIDPWRR